MRSLVSVLREDTSKPSAAQPGLAALPQLTEQMRGAGLPVDVRTHGERYQIPVGIDISAYRIVQEALTNTLRHARASHAWVDVRFEPGVLELEVRDDGTTAGGWEPGHGTVGIRERVALYGGDVHLGPIEGGGFRVNASLPIGGSR